MGGGGRGRHLIGRWLRSLQREQVAQSSQRAELVRPGHDEPRVPVRTGEDAPVPGDSGAQVRVRPRVFAAVWMNVHDAERF